MTKFDTLEDLLKRIYLLLPITIIEGDEFSPISEFNLFIRINRGSLSIHYVKTLYHLDDINQIIYLDDLDINYDTDGFVINENLFTNELGFFIDMNFSSTYKIKKIYE